MAEYPETGRAEAMTEYTVVFEKSATGWCAYYPDLPGLASCGSTFEETQRLTKEGLDLHLGAMLKAGDPIPAPRHVGAMLELDLPVSSATELLPARAA